MRTIHRVLFGARKLRVDRWVSVVQRPPLIGADVDRPNLLHGFDDVNEVLGDPWDSSVFDERDLHPFVFRVADALVDLMDSSPEVGALADRLFDKAMASGASTEALARGYRVSAKDFALLAAERAVYVAFNEALARLIEVRPTKPVVYSQANIAHRKEKRRLTRLRAKAKREGLPPPTEPPPPRRPPAASNESMRPAIRSLTPGAARDEGGA